MSHAAEMELAEYEEAAEAFQRLARGQKMALQVVRRPSSEPRRTGRIYG